MKQHANVSIESGIIEAAKMKGLNMSEIAEKALMQKLEIASVNIDRSIESCEFCGREDKKCVAENPNKGLCWLYPDEKWICQSCLKSKSRCILK